MLLARLRGWIKEHQTFDIFLLDHFRNATFVYAPNLEDVELRASNSTLSIPFSGVLAQIEASLSDLNMVTALAALNVEEIYRDSRHLIKAANIVLPAAFEAGFRDEDLVDGSVKFRADRAWVVNWGSSVSEAGIGENMWEFTGDISAAFPTGTASLNGSNIPVRAGRYDISFNTRTLEYSFELVEADD